MLQVFCSLSCTEDNVITIISLGAKGCSDNILADFNLVIRTGYKSVFFTRESTIEMSHQCCTKFLKLCT